VHHPTDQHHACRGLKAFADAIGKIINDLAKRLQLQLICSQ
jgi:hypothetical protein